MNIQNIETWDKLGKSVQFTKLSFEYDGKSFLQTKTEFTTINNLQE